MNTDQPLLIVRIKELEFMWINMKKLIKERLAEEPHYINNGDNIDDDNEYEPSPDTEKYREWELKERFLNEMVELNKEVGGRGKKQK